MDSAELDAACERHGIETSSAKNDVVTSGFLARFKGWDIGRMGVSDTEADAVCALLKARYGMTASDGAPYWIGGRRWFVTADVGSERHAQHGPTELAAVLALADRLKEGGS